MAFVGSNPQVLARTGGAAKRYHRVALVDAHGEPVTPSSLAVGQSYVFNYPYRTTPCFLLDLGKPALPNGSLKTEAGKRYQWPGGVGPDRSIVSFAAICAHKMTHPAKSVSFINYRHAPTTYLDKDERAKQREQVIYCCSEKSVYDPAKGATVLGGPAKQPLAAILLEHDDDGMLYAAGTFGGEMYEKFFATFGFRLQLEFETTDIQSPVTNTAEVVSIEAYSKTLMMC